MIVNISELVQIISTAENSSLKRDLFLKFARELQKPGNNRQAKKLIPLLYDNDSEIRKEAAHLIERLNIDLTGEDHRQYLIAIHDFYQLTSNDIDSEEARKQLFNVLCDKNLRVRAHLLRYLNENDCNSWQEIVLYHYGRTDYEKLHDIFLAGNDEVKQYVISQLRNGTKIGHNTEYHRRQCAQFLDRICAMEELGEEIKQLLNNHNNAAKCKIKLEFNHEEPKEISDLDLLIEKIQSNGIIIDSQIRYPEIRIGPATGRITYRNPGIQVWPAEKRIKSISPPQNYKLLMYDFVAVEPTILLNLLILTHVLSLADVPDGDLYLALSPGNRDAGKKFINTVINGGRYTPDFNPGPFLWKMVEGTDILRNDLYESYHKNNYIETISGRRITIDKKSGNFTGKLMNRLVQGSAADLFNNSLLEIDKKLVQESIDAQIYFLIYDEVWITYNKEKSTSVDQMVSNILENQYKKYGLILPIKIRKKHSF